MKKKKISVASLLLALIFSAAPLEAYIDACYEYDPYYDPTWSAGINGLFLKPFAPDAFLNITASTDSPTYQFCSLNPSYSVGFDLFVTKEIPQCYTSFCLNWQHIHFKDKFLNSKNQTNPATQEYFNKNRALSDSQHDRINLRSLREFLDLENFDLEVFFGASYLHLQEKRINTFDSHSTLNLLTIKDSSTLNAALGELGIRGVLHLRPTWFYLIGEVGVVTGIGNRETVVEGRSIGNVIPARWNEVSQLQLESSPSSCFYKGSRCLCFTGIEYAFEVGIKGNWKRFQWKIQAGYEGTLYWNLSSYFAPTNGGALQLTNSDFGFAGLYLGATLALPF